MEDQILIRKLELTAGRLEVEAARLRRTAARLRREMEEPEEPRRDVEIPSPVRPRETHLPDPPSAHGTSETPESRWAEQVDQATRAAQLRTPLDLGVTRAKEPGKNDLQAFSESFQSVIGPEQVRVRTVMPDGSVVDLDAETQELVETIQPPGFLTVAERDWRREAQDRAKAILRSRTPLGADGLPVQLGERVRHTVQTDLEGVVLEIDQFGTAMARITGTWSGSWWRVNKLVHVTADTEEDR